MALLIRLLLGALAWRFVRARQTGRPVVDVGGVRRRVSAAREPVWIAGRLAVVIVLTCFTAVLLAAGTTVLTLGPRWLGGLMVGLAVVFGLATAPEIVRLRRVVQARRRRRRESELRRKTESPRA